MDDSENTSDNDDSENEEEQEKQPDIADIRRSMARAKARIFDIAFCNDWSYFLTITWDDSIIEQSQRQGRYEKAINVVE